MKIYTSIFLTLVSATALGQDSRDCTQNCVGSYQKAAQECASSGTSDVVANQTIIAIQASSPVDNKADDTSEKRPQISKEQLEFMRKQSILEIAQSCMKASMCCKKVCTQESQNDKSRSIEKNIATCQGYIGLTISLFGSLYKDTKTNPPRDQSRDAKAPIQDSKP